MIEPFPHHGIQAPRGTRLHCKGWHQEAALRMLMNNLDPDVAERPDELIIYGGSGKAARNWECYDAIVRSLLELENDETLLVQSGKPVGVFRTHEYSPRVLIANSNLVGNWSNWDEFRRLEALGLMMYGQMTAGSWIYIGSQGIIQGTYETFSALARRHFGGDLRGRILVSGGLGGMGGAQPLAATMAGAAFLGIEVDPQRIEKRLRTGYCDRMSHDLDEALAMVEEAARRREALSVGLVGNCAEVLPELVRRGFTPDVLTDQTSAHDPLNGYIPAGLSLADAAALRGGDPAEYQRRSMDSIAAHVRAMLEMQARGAVTFDYGNNIRGQALKAGVSNALDFPGFVPAYIRPLFCEGRGPFRWAALSGDPADIAITDDLVLEMFPHDETLSRWIRLARERIRFQGLPARICWLGYGERAAFGLRINELVRRGETQGPDRHGPRPPGLRLRRLALPRDREHERHLRRRGGLAHPQRPAQHRGRSLVGVVPQRRGGRDRLFAARRAGHGRGRHHRDGRADRAGADQRPRHRRRTPRRCRLRGSRRLRQTEGDPHPCAAARCRMNRAVFRFLARWRRAAAYWTVVASEGLPDCLSRCACRA